MPPQMPPYRRAIRLDHDLYADTTAVCSVTLCTHERANLFAGTALAEACLATLRTHSKAKGVPVYAYCFMPDHLHLLIGPSQESSIMDFLRDFKSLCTRAAWEQGHVGRVWQPRFYDHFLRGEEDLRRVVEYLLGNPVRKGMVAEWRDYPYCGSLVFDL